MKKLAIVAAVAVVAGMVACKPAETTQAPAVVPPPPPAPTEQAVPAPTPTPSPEAQAPAEQTK